MWADLSHPWQACLEQAWEAYRAGTIPIGAVITGPGGEVLAAGRNRIFDPRLPAVYLAGVRLAHAEMNALLALDGQPVDPRACTLFTTTEPCPMCAGAIVMANVRRVCFASRDPWAGSTGLYQASPYMRKKNMWLQGPPDPALEDVLVGFQMEYYFREGPRRGISVQKGQEHGVLLRLAEMSPRGYALGQALFSSGLLARLASEGCPAGDVIDQATDLLMRGTFSGTDSLYT